VEVAGIEPASLSNPVKAATCLAPYFILLLQLLRGRIYKQQPLNTLAPATKANLPEPSC
jgi:hypothetical protein